MKNKIVLVDDNMEILELCSEILIQKGYSVESFREVAKAKDFLAHADVSQIHAIVSDIMMGPVDGLNFLSFVKSVPRLADIDFFLMTGALVAVFDPYFRPYVIKGVIRKPFTVIELVNALNFKDQHTSQKLAA